MKRQHNKKMLLGSIGAVIILLLASLSTVIGMENSRQKEERKISPLFSVHLRKENHQDTNQCTTSDYVGEGKETLSFPKIKKDEILPSKDITRLNTPILCFFLRLWTGIIIVQSILYPDEACTLGDCTFYTLCSWTVCTPLMQECHSPQQKIKRKIRENPLLENLVKNNPGILPEIAGD